MLCFYRQINYKIAKTLFSLIVHSSKRNNGSKYAQNTDFTGESKKLNLQ